MTHGADNRPDGADRTATAAQMAPHMLRGSIWMIGMRWAIRFIGLASTLVLVRILSPQDFGIIAIATIVTGLFEIFAETGQRLALIRHPKLTAEHLNSAWTMQVLICTGLAALIFLSAPLAEAYFREPQAGDIVRFLSLRLVFFGVENIGTIAFRRDLDFRREFRLGLYQKIGAAALTVTLAVVLQSFWALAIGIVVGQAIAVVISYVMHPFRPRFSFRHVRELWGFSIWVLIGNVSTYVQSRVDQIALGRVTDSTRLGQYTVAMDVATMPTLELALPASKALFPTYSRLGGDMVELKKAYLMTLSAVAAICWSAGAGVALVSHDFVAVLLGAQWMPVVAVVPWLALSGAVYALSNTVLTVHQAIGRARRSAIQGWIRVAVMVPLVVLAAQTGDLERVAQAQFAASVIFAPLLFASLRPVLRLSFLDVARANLRPAVATIAMAAAVLALIALLAGMHPLPRLLLSVATGAIVFVVVLLGVWRIMGRPPGIEHVVSGALGKLRPKQASKS